VDLLQCRSQRVIEFQEFSDASDEVERPFGRWLMM
jgi:hypothetical protein